MTWNPDDFASPEVKAAIAQIDANPVTGELANQETDPTYFKPAPQAAGREEIAALIASKFECEKDCQSAPRGCGCALDAADAVLALTPQDGVAALSANARALIDTADATVCMASPERPYSVVGLKVDASKLNFIGLIGVFNEIVDAALSGNEGGTEK